MKKMMLVVLVGLAVVFVGSLAMAEEKTEADFQKLLLSLDKLQEGCPYSFSEELILKDMLETLVEEFDSKMSDPSLSKKNFSHLLVLKKRIEGILNGSCCKAVRSLEKVQEMLFDLQNDFKTPSNQNWWEATKDDWGK